MKNYNFFKTDDNSTGLYNLRIGDIYHSKTGAYKESNEKFISPSYEILKNKNNIKLLDICTGIGYNLKAFINKFIDKELIIDCIDIDDSLVKISPFIKDGIDNQSIKFFLLNEILKNNIRLDDLNMELKECLNLENKHFFDEDMLNLIYFLSKSPYKTMQTPQKGTFLHNIYYNYISFSNSKDEISHLFLNKSIKYHFNDARIILNNIHSTYDVIFLDAFSPQKDPSLWTIDFLSLISNAMHNNSILISYSRSTPFRSALLELNLNVGKTILNNEDFGTIASKNKNNIFYPLTNYDLKLIATRSGITYKDINLNLDSSTIINNRVIEQNNSNRISHTKFLKNIE